MKKIYTIIILILISFITGCNDESISIELDNASSQIESTNLWSLESINEASGFEIVDSLMYLINSDNHLDIIDLELGKKEKEIIIDNSDSARSPELSVYKNYVSVNYKDYILVYDVESKSVVNRIKPVGYESPNISSVELYEDTVVFWSYSSEKLHCINFITNDLVWEKGGNREEHGKISVWEFDNEYYISSIHKKFSKIDPRNGNIIKSYDLMKVGRLDDGRKANSFYRLKDEDINEKLRYDLLKRTLGPFRVDKHYNYYSIGASYLFVFNDIGELLWQYDCGTEIIQSSVVGDFISIALANDKIVIIDLNSRSVVHEEYYKLNDRGFVLDYRDSFIMIGAQGKIKCLSINVDSH